MRGRVLRLIHFNSGSGVREVLFHERFQEWSVITLVEDEKENKSLWGICMRKRVKR